MATGGHIGNVTWKQINIESCVIPLFLLILARRIHFWHRFCILTSPTIKIKDSNSFSAICVYFLVLFLAFWRAQTSKFKMATNGHIENLTPKKIVLETGIISLFLLIIAHRANFWHHLCIFTGLNVKTKDGRHLSFPLFSDLSHSIHCSCWMSHQKLVSSNICWFYVLLLHIFPQWSPRNVEMNNFFK